MSKILIQDMSFYYEPCYVPVFERVNLVLDTDWRLGLVGRNGRGKTTFLKLLEGEREPVQGKIAKSVTMEYYPYRYETAYKKTKDVLKEIIGGFKSMEDAMERLLLRPGKEAYRSARAIVEALKRGIERAGFDANIVNIVEDTSRRSATEIMEASGLVDLLIPRGGAGLIRACVEHATVPCIETGTGICHVYVDKDADLEQALSIISNAKTSRPSVCNAEEVCLVHRDIAKTFLPMLKNMLVDAREQAGLCPVELRLDEAAREIIPGTKAGERDFDTEFLDYILAVGVVDSLDAAIAHVQAHSTHHSDAIVTENEAAAERFLDEIDSAAVYVNASTRFTDGGEFGLGCEMGISTQKLHARGPMGLRELTTYHYCIYGNGQTR